MPAFGKSYTSAKEVVDAWEANVDFRVYGGPYVSKNTWKEYGNCLDHITFCWKDVTVVVEKGIGGIF